MGLAEQLQTILPLKRETDFQLAVKILHLLSTRSATSDEIANMFGRSRMTIQRMFIAMDRAYLVNRIQKDVYRVYQSQGSAAKTTHAIHSKREIPGSSSEPFFLH